MSTSTAPAVSSLSPGLIGRLAGVELLKLRTTRMWWGLLIPATVVVILLTLAQAAAAVSGLNGAPLPAEDLRVLYGQGFTIGYIFVLALGIIAMAGEYRHKTITSTLLATPQRGQLVTAKMLAMFVAGAAYGLVLTFAAALTTIIVLATQGQGAGLGADGVLRTLALAILGSGLWGIYGVGLATLIRNQVAALFVALGLRLIIEPLLRVFASLWHVTAVISQYLPGSASEALISGSVGGQGGVLSLLPWWGGSLTLLGYALLFAALGWLLTTRRDVT